MYLLLFQVQYDRIMYYTNLTISMKSISDSKFIMKPRITGYNIIQILCLRLNGRFVLP